MKSFLSLAVFEWKRLLRSRMRAFAIVVFLLCGIYAIESGVRHLDAWKWTLEELELREKTQREQARGWFDSGQTGPGGRSAVNITQPRYADRYAVAHAVMDPEPLAALAIGLSDIRSSWASVSAMSGARPFQTSDPSTLGNAEKLLAGNFDLVFVFAYLMPLLLLVLLFDVGTLERDLGMMRLVRTQSRSARGWWLQRLALPIGGVVGLVLILCVIGGLWTGALGVSFDSWIAFTALSIGYTLLWGALFGAVLSAGTGTSAAAIWMVGLWLAFCVLVPAAVRQVVSRDYPSLYSTELTSVLRAERYEILLGDAEFYEKPFYEKRTHLNRPPAGTPRGVASNMNRMVRQAAFLDVVDDVTVKMADIETKREKAVAQFGWVNPAYVLQRALCVLAGTESVSYRQHRQDVFDGVSSRLEELIESQWSGDPIDRAQFEGLLAYGPRKGYGLPPEGGTYVQLLVLTALGLVAGVFFGGRRKKRERETGVV